MGRDPSAPHEHSLFPRGLAQAAATPPEDFLPCNSCDMRSRDSSGRIMMERTENRTVCMSPNEGFPLIKASGGVQRQITTVEGN